MPSYSIHYDGDDRELLEVAIDAVVAEFSAPPVVKIAHWDQPDIGPDTEIEADFYIHKSEDGVLSVSPYSDDTEMSPTPTSTILVSSITEITFY